MSVDMPESFELSETGLNKLTKKQLIALVLLKEGEVACAMEEMENIKENEQKLEHTIIKLQMEKDVLQQQVADSGTYVALPPTHAHIDELCKLLGLIPKSELWNEVVCGFSGGAFRLSFQREYYLANRDACREFLKKLSQRAHQRKVEYQHNPDHLAIHTR